MKNGGSCGFCSANLLIGALIVERFYFFSFFAISCIKRGLSSARTSSTMLARALASSAEVCTDVFSGPTFCADSEETEAAKLDSAISATDSASALAFCGLMTESRICCQFCHAAAASEGTASAAFSLMADGPPETAEAPAVADA